MPAAGSGSPNFQTEKTSEAETDLSATEGD